MLLGSGTAAGGESADKAVHRQLLVNLYFEPRVASPDPQDQLPSIPRPLASLLTLDCCLSLFRVGHRKVLKEQNSCLLAKQPWTSILTGSNSTSPSTGMSCTPGTTRPLTPCCRTSALRRSPASVGSHLLALGASAPWCGHSRAVRSWLPRQVTGKGAALLGVSRWSP